MNGRAWSESELQLLRELYPSSPTRQIAAELKRPRYSVFNQAFKLGLKKSDEFRELDRIEHSKQARTDTRMIASRFQKGSVPVNKGLRRPGWHTGRMRDTQFKKGQRSGIAAERWCPIGTIKADSEGYLRIKVRERTSYAEEPGWNKNVWPLLSYHVWEKHHGRPVPPKHVLIFKDRDRSNCAIENLELISMAENARRNHWKNTLPPELAQVIQLN